MSRFILLFSVFLIIASFNLPEGQCLKKSKVELRADQTRERLNKATRNELQTQSLTIRSSGELEDDSRSLFPREENFWQQQLLSRLPTVAGFVIGQIPGVFRFIYQICTSSEGECRPSGSETTLCIIDEALKIFPPTLSGRLAKAVVLDILKKKAQDIYTPENVLSVVSMCGKFLQKPSSQPDGTDPNIFSSCFLDAVKEMHPLQQYAPAALQQRASGYFDSIAKICHDKMPTELSNRREMSRYYFECFIDTASADYKDKWQVKFGRLWLEPYINNPDAMFNREKILDIAEDCEDKSRKVDPEERNGAVFFCFFRGMLSLHPRTKVFADYLMKYEGVIGIITDGRPKTMQRLMTAMSSKKKKIGLTWSRKGTDDNNPQHQKDLIDCVSRALTSAFVSSFASPSFTGLLSKIPFVGGFFQGSNVTPASIAQSFAEAVTPCFKFFSQNDKGEILFDYEYAMNTAKETAKWDPTRILAISAAGVLTENVTVKHDKNGKPQYIFNYQNLAVGLGKAFVNSEKLGRVGSKLMGSGK